MNKYIFISILVSDGEIDIQCLQFVEANTPQEALVNGFNETYTEEDGKKCTTVEEIDKYYMEGRDLTGEESAACIVDINLTCLETAGPIRVYENYKEEKET